MAWHVRCPCLLRHCLTGPTGRVLLVVGWAGQLAAPHRGPPGAAQQVDLDLHPQQLRTQFMCILKTQPVGQPSMRPAHAVHGCAVDALVQTHVQVRRSSKVTFNVKSIKP